MNLFKAYNHPFNQTIFIKLYLPIPSSATKIAGERMSRFRAPFEAAFAAKIDGDRTLTPRKPGLKTLVVRAEGERTATVKA